MIKGGMKGAISSRTLLPLSLLSPKRVPDPIYLGPHLIKKVVNIGEAYLIRHVGSCSRAHHGG